MKRFVPCNLWDYLDAYDDISHIDRLVTVYLLTNPRVTQLGIYRIRIKQIANDLDLSQDQVKASLQILEDDLNLIRYDFTSHEIALIQSLKYSICKGGRPMMDLLTREIQQVQSLDLLQVMLEAMNSFWLLSKRSVDQSIRDLFKQKIQLRELVAYTHDDQGPIDVQAILDQAVDEISTAETVESNESDSSDSKSKHNTTNNSVIEDFLLSFNQAEALKHPLITYYCQLHDSLETHEAENILAFLDHLSEEVIKAAIVRSYQVKNPYPYTLKLLNNWKKAGVQSPADLDQLDREYRQSQKKQGGYQEVQPAWFKSS